MKCHSLVAGIALAVLSVGVVQAEEAQCSFHETFLGTQGIWHIKAAREGLPVVTYKSTSALANNTDAQPADVLYHSYTGIPNALGLGISSIMVRQPEGDGFVLPSLITIDWTTLKFGHAYVPFLQERDKFMLANSRYECVRVD